ncbi:hypothetical protein RF11_09338 [Thelohanellus kitauei]|uniref:C2H2-type domain-containing protein n=1 Tax=Thelohanellus kitauei TaxID=669202 RepID=A0A0C2IFR7_THEKT|nr:hypothetical protein RF11_09338 [Thelohanellus kitauei]
MFIINQPYQHSMKSQERHYIAHSKIKQFKCNVINCNTRCTSKRCIEKHIGIHPIQRGRKCPFCDYVVYGIYEKNDHLVIHPEKILNMKMFDKTNDSDDS